MAVNSVDTNTDVSTSSETQFNAAVDNAQSSDMTDEEFTNELISQAVIVGGQFIIMPRAQEMLNDAQSDDDEE